MAVTKNDKPKEAGVRRAISPAVFDRVFEAGIERGNALDTDEPKLSPPTPVVAGRPKSQE